jgi:hypothetical protein
MKIKSYLLFTILTFFLTSLTFVGSAQAPLQIPYQGVARDVQGLALQNQLITLRLTIEDVSGANLFQEILQTTTNQFGLFNVKIGNIIPLNIDWSNGTKFLHVEMDPQGGGSYTDLGATQFLSVPYALYAETAANGGTVGPQGPAGPQGPIGPQGPAGPSGGLPNGNVAGEMLYWNGSAWVSIAPGQNGDNLVMCNGIPTWGSCPINLANIQTTIATNISTLSAASGGIIVSDGNGTISQIGIVYGTAANPVYGIESSTSEIISGNSFTSAISGLSPGTMYYYRAYAINEAGISYGNTYSFTTLNYQIGGIGPGGGIIFYDKGEYSLGLNQPAWRYMEVASADLSFENGYTFFDYGCNNVNLSGAEYSIIGGGFQNTVDINNGCSSSQAAGKMCWNAVINGFDDWFMPSKDEMNIMYTNLTPLGLGNFSPEWYWSSTEASNANAWRKHMSAGNIEVNGKSLLCKVRAVRVV